MFPHAGGQISAQSEVGRGSIFTFNIKVKQSINQGGLKLIEIASNEKLKVLAVDDHPHALEITGNYLQQIGHQSHAATSAKEAFKLLTQAQDEGSPFDVALLNWKMPEMDGLQTAQAIKERPDLYGAPECILVTTFAREQLRNQLEDYGISDMMVKPINPQSLQSHLHHLFHPEEVLDSSQKLFAQKEFIQDFSQLQGARVLLAEDNEINQHAHSRADRLHRPRFRDQGPGR